MDDKKIYSIAVIGGGSGGTMATLRAILNNDDCLMFPGSPKHRKKSRAFWVAKIDNIPAYTHYKKGIVEPNKQTIDWILESDFKDKLTLVKNTGVEKMEKLEDGLFKLVDNKDKEYFVKYIILSTGVMDVQPEIGGSVDPILPFANVQLVDYCLRCDGHHSFEKHTGIIGHDSGAAWVAIMLHERYDCPSMTIFTNGNKTEFDKRTSELINLYKIQVNENEIVEVLGNAKEQLLEGFRFSDGSQANIDFGFVSLGMIVYNDLALQLGADVDKRGFVLTDHRGQSSVEGLYVAGDLRAGIKNQIYTAWDSAVDSADTFAPI